MRTRLLLAFLPLFGLIAGCGKGSPAAAPPAVEKPRVEADLVKIVISPQARKSLGVQTAPIQQCDVQERLPLPGWVMARQGHEVTLTAEVGGHVGLPRMPAAWPVLGRKVDQGQDLLMLEPVLTPLDQVQLAALKRGVENELAKAKDSVVVAESELKRALDLQRQGLRGQDVVDKAQAQLKHVMEDQASAQDKIKLFVLAEKGAKLPPKAVAAPLAGTVLTVHVSPGQYVPAAAPLVTIANLSQVWLRVPIPESDLPRVDPGQPVTIALTVANLDGIWDLHFEAAPVALVPLVDVNRHTADLIYAIGPEPKRAVRRPSAAGKEPKVPPPPPRISWSKDQMIKVHVPFGQRRMEIVVPYSAVVYDAFGGSWIYLDKTDAKDKHREYERRRVDLGAPVRLDPLYVLGLRFDLPEVVVVRCDCKRGDKVVVGGAAALFSREFHKPPIQAGTAGPVDDDDD